MAPETILAVLGNAVALVVLGWKTFYDLFWNKRRFQREKGGDILEAARAKRERSDFTAAIVFLVLAISYGLLMGETIMSGRPIDDRAGSPQERSGRSAGAAEALSGRLRALEGRVKEVEDYLFPPGGPTSPAEYTRRLDKLQERLEALEADGAEKDRKFRELVEIVAELKQLVKERHPASSGHRGELKARG